MPLFAASLKLCLHYSAPSPAGKTAQLITYLGCIRHLEKDPGPHLVVVPASLLENWQRELRRWCPALKVRAVVGWGAAMHAPNHARMMLTDRSAPKRPKRMCLQRRPAPGC